MPITKLIKRSTSRSRLHNHRFRRDSFFLNSSVFVEKDICSLWYSSKYSYSTDVRARWIDSMITISYDEECSNLNFLQSSLCAVLVLVLQSDLTRFFQTQRIHVSKISTYLAAVMYELSDADPGQLWRLHLSHFSLQAVAHLICFLCLPHLRTRTI